MQTSIILLVNTPVSSRIRLEFVTSAKEVVGGCFHSEFGAGLNQQMDTKKQLFIQFCWGKKKKK